MFAQADFAPKVKNRHLIRAVYAAHYRWALTRQQSRPGQRRIGCGNARGRSSAYKTMLLTAIASTLKKLLKHQPGKILRLAIALSKPSAEQRLLSFVD